MDGGDKFILSWNDFKSALSNSLNCLRNENSLYDVTLLTDDEVEVNAHKIVLSASSEFFKKILNKATHQHPLLYLSGVHSADLKSLLDFVYQGEASVHQHQVDSFLEAASKLKILGLTTNNLQAHKVKKATATELQGLQNTSESPDSPVDNVGMDLVSTVESAADSVVPITDDSLSNKISSLIIKCRNTDTMRTLWRCSVCSRESDHLSNMRSHVELHIHVSRACDECGKTFNTKNSLRIHKYRNHSKTTAALAVDTTTKTKPENNDDLANQFQCFFADDRDNDRKIEERTKDSNLRDWENQRIWGEEHVILNARPAHLVSRP